MRRSIALAVAAVAVLTAFLTGGCTKKPGPETAQIPAPGQEKPALMDYYTGFKRAEKGDWAEWVVETGGKTATVRYTYVGVEVIKGNQAYGLEFSGELGGKKAAQQVWLSCETKEPVRFVVKLPQGTFCLDVSLYRSPPATGSPQPETPQEYHPEKIKPLQYTLGTFTTQSGKTIKVVKVVWPDKKQEVWLSSEPPFGLVQFIAEGKTLMTLKDFGSGARPEISREEMLNCRQFNIPALPQFPGR